jgi:hypothetical protein
MNQLICFSSFLFFIIFSISVSFGQTDPPQNPPEESADTIIIQKSPVVVRKPLIIEEEVKPSNKFLEVFVSPFDNMNYYKVCPDCGDYLVKLKEVTKPAPGYSAGANFVFMNKHLFTSLGITYTNVRETFNYPGINKSINSFKYLDLHISGGYRIKSNRLSVVINGGGIISSMISLKGHTISEADTISSVDIKNQQQFRKTSYSLTLGLKFIYELGYKVSIVVEPVYCGNISSLTKRDELYVVQRNFLGSKLGLLYAF